MSTFAGPGKPEDLLQGQISMIYKSLLVGVLAVAGVAAAQNHDWKRGDAAPSFMVSTIDGNRVTLKDLNPGQTKFLYFIHNGDQINTAASSFIHRILHAYMPAKAKWYGVFDGDEAHARSWLATYDTPYQMLMDRDRTVVHAFQVQSSPTVIEIDGNGKIVKEWVGLSGAGMKNLNRFAAEANGVKSVKL